MKDEWIRLTQPRMAPGAAPESRFSWSPRFKFAKSLQPSKGASIISAVGLAWILLLLFSPSRIDGAELKPETVKAFDQYVQRAELRIDEQLKSGNSFLWIDTLPAAERAAAYARLRDGGIVVHPFAAGTDIPGGMIHDWVGVAFIPNATLDETLAQIQNYNAYARFYSPEVARAEILARNGNDFKVSLWLQKKSVVTVVLNVVEDIQYFRLDSSRVYSCAHSIRIVEVENAAVAPDLTGPSAAGSGYLWKLNGYGWFLQTPAGVFVQLEAIALSRNIPWGLGWLIKPFVIKVPRDSLTFTLARARASLQAGSAETVATHGDSTAKPASADGAHVDLDVDNK